MTLAAVSASSGPAALGRHVRAMVVDDSAVIRGILTRWLEADKGIRVEASATNGAVAVKLAERQEFDVIILDIEMPEMDGLTALPLLLKAQPGVQVIMASTLTARNADISLRAMQLGAADYIPKPESKAMITGGDEFRNELCAKVYAFSAIARKMRHQSGGEEMAKAAVDPVRAVPPAPAPAPALARPAAAQPSEIRTSTIAQASVAGSSEPDDGQFVNRKSAVQLAKFNPGMPKILMIGSSTGGPQALFVVLKSIPVPSRVPIVITQHMPKAFTAILAQHIQRLTGHDCREAVDGEALVPGRVYVAPGDRHVLVTGSANAARISLSDGPPVNFCKPAVDPMFRSGADVFAGAALAAVLTGMGQDGAYGARYLIAKGCNVVVQDEASSVVWGMPGAVAHLGAASRILPLDQLGASLNKMIAGGNA